MLAVWIDLVPQNIFPLCNNQHESKE
jgi:hypothetical protein